jgi:hypothetical protein
MGSFLIKDGQGHVYPARSKRLAPDFFFHSQVYRGDGEEVILPHGDYEFVFSRGPESLPEKRKVTINTDNHRERFQVKRWIDPSLFGWWSGDHHIHAAGCAHYNKPTEGVHAKDMIRHCLGEDLKVGCNLTWGPCFDYQKQFFTGANDVVSKPPYLLRYDIEVSGFGSHQSGHLCLLQLKQQIPAGGDSTKHWPTLGLNTLRWAKKQGALTGPAHSANGLDVPTTDLPNYIIPPYNGIGANEFIVDVTHQVPGHNGKLVPAIDFISTMDTSHVAELNMWYHVLNCGFRPRASGETDFPCITGEKVGMGRSYVQLGKKLTFEDWCEGIRQGRNYVSDGKTHFLQFSVNGLEMGTKGSELKVKSGKPLQVKTRVAAMLPVEAQTHIKNLPVTSFPTWDIERARIDTTRKVPVELIVNGWPVARQEIEADGKIQDLTWNLSIGVSSWVAVRVLPSAHSNPIFVLLDGKPIRASKASAEWCLKGVDQCWSQKERFIAPAEMQDAIKAYDHARAMYRKIMEEAVAD